MAVTVTTSVDAGAELRLVANQIDAVAQSAGAARPLLRRLAEDLRGGGVQLAGTDLLTAYPPGELLPDRPVRRQGLVQALIVVRDLTVFVPVGITWWTLRGAVTAWAAAKTDESLLHFWQTNPSVTPISASAQLIAGTLVVMGALTVLVGAMDRMAARNADLRVEREQLAAALATANLLLSARSPTGAPTDRELDRIAAQIFASSNLLAAALERVCGNLDQMLQDGPENQVLAALSAWKSSAEALTKVGEELTGPTRLAEEWVALRKGVEAEDQRLRVAVGQLVENLEAAAAQAAVEARAHTQVADSVRDSTRQLAMALHTFGDRTEFLERLMYQMRRLLQMLEMEVRHPGVSEINIRDNATGHLPGGQP